jgi:hypothetical protein
MTVVTYDVVRERVARGAALLDERSPGWFRTLVPESIDTRYYDQCVLGSLNPEVGYAGVRNELEVEEDLNDIEGTTVWYGFDVTLDEDGGESYARLTDTWRNLIAERQIKAGLR